MTVKAKAAKEDPETKVRRELAEQRAEAGRLSELGENVDADTQAVLRRFGRINGPAAFAPSGFSIPAGSSGGFGNIGGGTSAALSGGLAGTNRNDRNLILR